MKYVGQSFECHRYQAILDIRFLDDHRTAQTTEAMQSITDNQGEADRTPDNSFFEDEAKTRMLRRLTLIIPFTSYET